MISSSTASAFFLLKPLMRAIEPTESASKAELDEFIYAMRSIAQEVEEDPQFVLKAFEEGADGVLIGGCHPGDCHYPEGNYKALRPCRLLKRVLKQFGVEEERVRLEWISASEGDRVQHVINEMTERLRQLGPWQRQGAQPWQTSQK